LKATWSGTFGGVVVRLFERAPAVVVTDLVAAAAAAPGSVQRGGLVGRGPEVVLAEVGFEPHRCVQFVPLSGDGGSITFPAVALGHELVGGVGLADVFTRRDERAPIELVVMNGTQELARVRAGVDDGWVRWRGVTTPGTGSITFFARVLGKHGTRDRLVCVAAEARQ
jgi:hypothetical protein